MQFNAALMPLAPFALRPQPLLRRPTDVVHDPRNRPRAAVLHEVNAVFVGELLEERQEEGVGVCCFRCGDVLLVKDVVQERGELYGEEIWLRGG